MAATEPETEVEIFVNRREFELSVTSLTGAQLLERTGFTGPAWDLFKLQGEGDPTGGELISATRTLELKDGDRFRVIPGNRTFGAS